MYRNLLINSNSESINDTLRVIHFRYANGFSNFRIFRQIERTPDSLDSITVVTAECSSLRSFFEQLITIYFRQFTLQFIFLFVRTTVSRNNFAEATRLRSVSF